MFRDVWNKAAVPLVGNRKKNPRSTETEKGDSKNKE
jgi:hypothetical protein